MSKHVISLLKGEVTNLKNFIKEYKAYATAENPDERSRKNWKRMINAARKNLQATKEAIETLKFNGKVRNDIKRFSLSKPQTDRFTI